MEIIEHMFQDRYTDCKDLILLGKFLHDDVQNKKIIEILRLKELEVRFSDFKDFVNFYEKDTLDKHIKIVDFLLNNGFDIRYLNEVIRELDIDVRDPMFLFTARFISKRAKIEKLPLAYQLLDLGVPEAVVIDNCYFMEWLELMHHYITQGNSLKNLNYEKFETIVRHRATTEDISTDYVKSFLKDQSINFNAMTKDEALRFLDLFEDKYLNKTEGVTLLRKI